LLIGPPEEKKFQKKGGVLPRTHCREGSFRAVGVGTSVSQGEARGATHFLEMVSKRGKKKNKEKRQKNRIWLKNKISSKKYTSKKGFIPWQKKEGRDKLHSIRAQLSHKSNGKGGNGQAVPNSR